MTRVGVVGHVEWVQFARVPRVPVAGEIVRASDAFEVPGGGGSVAAVQLRKLAGQALFLTALGDDAVGRRAAEALRDEHGVDLRPAWRDAPQRRAFTYLDAAGERTITILGERLVPERADPLGWADLAHLDAVYVTGGDPDAVRGARSARVLIATPRILPTLAESGVALDVLVSSAIDPDEAYVAGTLDPGPAVIVRTAGAAGGSWTDDRGRSGGWQAAPVPAAVPGAVPGAEGDAYGCGDSFAAGLTYGLGAGLDLPDAIELAARCGAACRAGRGPFAGQLEAA